MSLTELQGYAAAFSDMSNAMTLGGKTSMLANAIDEAIEKMKDKEIQIRVTPIWQWGDTIPENLIPGQTATPSPEGISNSYAQNMSYNISFPDVMTVNVASESVNAITAPLVVTGNSIKGAVNNLNTTMSSIEVRLDTGVLVGKLAPRINKYLGRSYTPRTSIHVYSPSTVEAVPS